MKILQVAIALDQLAGAILMNCDADETMSAKLYRCRNKNLFYRVGEKVVNRLFFWQERHCFNAYLSEIKRRQLPKEYLQ